MVKGYWVWTRRDPSADDIIREIPKPSKFMMRLSFVDMENQPLGWML